MLGFRPRAEDVGLLPVVCVCRFPRPISVSASEFRLKILFLS